MHKRKAGEATKVKAVPKPTSLLRLVARNFGSEKHLEGDKPYSSSLETIVRKSYDGRVQTFRGATLDKAFAPIPNLHVVPRLAPKRSL